MVLELEHVLDAAIYLRDTLLDDVAQLSSYVGIPYQYDQETLSFAANSILIGAVPIIWLSQKNSADIVQPGILMPLKAAAGLALFCVQAVTCYLKAQTFASTSLSCLATLCAVWIQFVKHRRSLQPSTLLAIWFVFGIWSNAIYAHHSILHVGTQSSEFHLSAAAICFKTLMLLLDELPKHSLIIDEDTQKAVSHDETAGFISRFLVLWLSRTFLFGFRGAPGTTTSDDLDPELSAERLLQQFTSKWNKANKYAPRALLWTCFKSFPLQFIYFGLMRLTHAFFLLLQPLIIRSIAKYIFETYQIDHDKRIALFLIETSISVYFAILVSNTISMHLNTRINVIVRGMLTSTVYQKSLRLAAGETDQIALTNLIDQDIPQLIEGISNAAEFSERILHFGLYILFLKPMLGNMAFFSMAPGFITAILRWITVRAIDSSAGVWNESVQKRVEQTSTMLKQIKAIKMVGLARIMADNVRQLRSKEVGYLTTVRRWVMLSFSLASVSLNITPPFVLMTSLSWAMWQQSLTPVDAFTVLAALLFVSEPMQTILPLAVSIRSAFRSAATIQEFLLCTEVHQQRKANLVDLVAADGLDQGEDKHRSNPRADDVVFELQNADLAIQGVHEPVLRNVNATLRKGTILVVVGRNGSGKSTLLRSLTGHTELIHGVRYKQNMKVAYCGQNTWLQNRSIRQNVLGFKPMDFEWYCAVLDICLLRPEIRILPKSDRTIVTTNGTNLSGGQRQRISIARAIYGKPDILVLDDIFSSLDRPTAMQIRKNMFAHGSFLRQSAVSVIMSARSTTDMEFGDELLRINEDGSVSQHPYQQMSNVGGNSTAATNTTSAIVPDAYVAETETFNAEEIRSLVVTHQKQDAKRSNEWSLYLFYLQTFSKIQVAMVFLTYILGSMIEKGPAVYVSMWFDAQSANTVFSPRGFFTFELLATVFFCWGTGSWTTNMLPASSEQLHELLLQTTIDSTMRFLTTTNFNHILTLFNHDIRTATTALPIYCVKLIYLNIVVLVQLGLIVSCSSRAMFAYPFAVACFYIGQYLYMRALSQVQYLDIETKRIVNTRFTDSINGLDHIQAFEWEAESLAFTLKCINASQRTFYHTKLAKEWISLMFETAKAAMSIMLVVAALWIMDPKAAGCVCPPLIAVITLSTESMNLIEMTTGWLECLGALRRIRNFMQRTPQERVPSAKERAELPKDWPQHGRVVMQNVSAKYDPSDKAPAILKDVSFMIMPGQKVGIVGPTGSGKTSLLMTMLNFLEYWGTIKIDGIDISKVPPHILRESITTVSQDFIEFNNTVRYNLCPWTMHVTTTEEGNAHEVSVIELLEEVGLWPLVVRHGGLDAKMSDLGLSEGQKQLMSVLRACLHKLYSGSRLVIMDEWTSQLDGHIMAAVKRAMEAAFWDCTIITVAHQPEALEGVDMIMHMRDGRLVRRDLPNEGNPSPAPPPPPPGMPQGPVAMTPFFEQMLQKSLQAEADVAAGLYD